MTEVSKMTDQQLNRALAELMGSNGDRTAIWIPCTDPAASLEVQTSAIAKDSRWYKYHLAAVTSGFDRIKHAAPLALFGPDMVDLMLTAIPRQRAEAAYMTLREVSK